MTRTRTFLIAALAATAVLLTGAAAVIESPPASASTTYCGTTPLTAGDDDVTVYVGGSTDFNATSNDFAQGGARWSPGPPSSQTVGMMMDPTGQATIYAYAGAPASWSTTYTISEPCGSSTISAQATVYVTVVGGSGTAAPPSASSTATDSSSSAPTGTPTSAPSDPTPTPSAPVVGVPIYTSPPSAAPPVLQRPWSGTMRLDRSVYTLAMRRVYRQWPAPTEYSSSKHNPDRYEVQQTVGTTLMSSTYGLHVADGCMPSFIRPEGTDLRFAVGITATLQSYRYAPHPKRPYLGSKVKWRSTGRHSRGAAWSKAPIISVSEGGVRAPDGAAPNDISFTVDNPHRIAPPGVMTYPAPPGTYVYRLPDLTCGTRTKDTTVDSVAAHGATVIPGPTLIVRIR